MPIASPTSQPYSHKYYPENIMAANDIKTKGSIVYSAINSHRSLKILPAFFLVCSAACLTAIFVTTLSASMLVMATIITLVASASLFALYHHDSSVKQAKEELGKVMAGVILKKGGDIIGLSDNNTDIKELFVKYGPHVESLSFLGSDLNSIVDSPEKLEKLLNNILLYFPHLKSLSICECPQVANANLSCLSKLRLEYLDLTLSPVKLTQLSHIAQIKTLKTLKLRDSSNYPLAGITKELSKLPDLQCLDIVHKENKIDDPHFLHAAGDLQTIKDLKQLRELHISHINDELFKIAIKDLILLTSLEIMESSQLTGVGFEILEKKKHLENLKLSGCKGLTADGIAHLVKVRSLRNIRFITPCLEDDQPQKQKALASLKTAFKPFDRMNKDLEGDWSR